MVSTEPLTSQSYENFLCKHKDELLFNAQPVCDSFVRFIKYIYTIKGVMSTAVIKSFADIKVKSPNSIYFCTYTIEGQSSHLFHDMIIIFNNDSKLTVISDGCGSCEIVINSIDITDWEKNEQLLFDLDKHGYSFLDKMKELCHILSDIFSIIPVNEKYLVDLCVWKKFRAEYTKLGITQN